MDLGKMELGKMELGRVAGWVKWHCKIELENETRQNGIG